MKLITFQSVSKVYSRDGVGLHDISFSVKQGEFSALAGPSGSGKTTILNLAAGLDKPTNGSVHFMDKELSKLGAKALCEWRRQEVGFVFQAYNLFPVLTVIENVEYPLALKRVHPKKRRALAIAALKEVGMDKYLKRLPKELSGGQQQRVAIARAIVGSPKIVFADEPTANLDTKTATQLLELFRELNERKGITFLFSSHDPKVLKVARRIIEVADGRIKSDTLQTSYGLSAEAAKLEVHAGAPRVLGTDPDSLPGLKSAA
jgi:putative ABC transport system ATP-binding protein